MISGVKTTFPTLMPKMLSAALVIRLCQRRMLTLGFHLPKLDKQ